MFAIRARASVIFVIALMLTACSSASTNDSTKSVSPHPSLTPASYVRTICSAAATWKAALQQAASDFTSREAGVTDLSVVRTNLVDYLNGLALKTDAFVAAIEAAGPPPVTNGAAEEASVVAAIKAGAQGFRDAATQAAGLSTSDPTALSAGVAKLATTIGKQIKVMSTAASNVKDPVLDPLYRADATCNQVEGRA